jgi:hypothetical protein
LSKMMQELDKAPKKTAKSKLVFKDANKDL